MPLNKESEPSEVIVLIFLMMITCLPQIWYKSKFNMLAPQFYNGLNAKNVQFYELWCIFLTHSHWYFGELLSGKQIPKNQEQFLFLLFYSKMYQLYRLIGDIS